MAKEKEEKGVQDKQDEHEKEIKEMVFKYSEKLKGELGEKAKKAEIADSEETTSREYKEFKQEYLPRHMSWYEKACNQSEKFLKIAPDKKREPSLRESIEICHLSITPTGAITFSVLGPALIAVCGVLLSFVLLDSMFFVFFFLILAYSLNRVFNSLPDTLANNWRLKASNQMVLCIFYVVTYMRHTSNLELAIEFASDHLSPPLSLDLKRVLWNIETETYSSIKESLDAYLETWKKWNNEFIESFHLVESSLYESSEERRLDLLDKSLSVILDETYEKMLHYAQELKTPITTLHMMGVILPILGLVILPLVVSFMCTVKWYHLATLYNITLPIIVYYFGKSVLSKRPTGYGATDISEDNPELKKYKNILFKIGGQEVKLNPAWVAFTIGFVLLIVGLSPIIAHIFNPSSDIIINTDNEIHVINSLQDPNAKFYFLGYRSSKGCGETQEGKGDLLGPYGLIASVMGILMPLGIALGMGLYFKFRSQNVIKIRDEANKLEKEFASALFQLGNRLGDGLPAEIAFTKVADTMEGSVSGNFFRLVSSNITRLGLSVQDAIFDSKVGALTKYPSNLIESSMKVLVESAKKGPLIAAQAIINVSRYIKEIHRVNERLKDLLSDIISSMKSQIVLTPVISGIVIGITSMITTILGKIGEQMSALAEKGQTGTGLLTMFGDGISTFYFQLVVGFYVVQIIYILTILNSGIENGEDRLNERFLLGKNLIRSSVLYFVISFIVMILFNLIAGQIMSTIKIGA